MITSTTELLNEIVEAATQNQDGGRITPESSQISTVLQQSRKDFAIRYGCMQSWFLRSSWLEKIKWLTQLLEGLKSIDSLSLILNTLRVSCSKSTVYEGCQYTTNFVYDKALQDHNRSIRKVDLAETQDEDIQWFKTLQDSEQILMLIGLIRLGGGAIMHQIYERGSKLYHQRVQVTAEDGRRSSIVPIKSETPASTTGSNCNIQVSRKPRGSIMEQLPTIAPRIFNIKPSNEKELETYDPKDPFVIEVEKQKKIWNDMITKYRIQVEGKPPKPAKAQKKGDTKSVQSKKSKGGKSTKSGKSIKSKKSSKSSKSSKGKKGKKGKGEGEGEGLDYIQLLPVWIVKKIFCYLDAKTLKKAKTVNKYWSYAIADLQKELKARKNLDKLIKKMEASVLSSQMQLEQKPEKLKEIIRDKSSTKKRLLKLAERGATLPELKGKLKPPLTDNCLLYDAVKLIPSDRYILPVTQVQTFPRSVAHAATLYKVPSCMVNELGFTKIYFEEEVEDDIRPIYTAKTADNVSHHSTRTTEHVSEEEIHIISHSM